MQLDHLWLNDFRGYGAEDVALSSGLTVVKGSNGAGKTNLLEAVGFVLTLSSFRGVGPEALVRDGAGAAVLRGQGRRAERRVLVEVELPRQGRARATLNRQPLRRREELLEVGRVTVLSPDDLDLVKGPPAQRRRYLDDGLVALRPRHEALRRDYDRVVRQRSRLLAQAGGRLTADVVATLDVWDTKLVETGEALAAARVEALERLRPLVAKAYDDLAVSGGASEGTGRRGATLSYASSWRQCGLAAALAAARTDELRRGLSLVGPHRDDLDLSVGGMPARTQASQGEQRCLALALRLSLHQAVAEATGEPPVLLLDDVFSELDAHRGQALLDHLPPGQALLTTTGALPVGANPDQVVEVVAGRLVPATPP